MPFKNCNHKNKKIAFGFLGACHEHHILDFFAHLKYITLALDLN
jgi:hypothetical protein